MSTTIRFAIAAIIGLSLTSFSEGFAGGALAFDDDVLLLPGAAFNGLGDFTVEMWVRSNSPHPTSAGDPTILSLANNPIDNELVIQRLHDETGFLVHYNGEPVLFVTAPLSLNQWYHLAIVRQGTTLRAFLTGASAGQTTIDTQPLAVAADGACLGLPRPRR